MKVQASVPAISVSPPREIPSSESISTALSEVSEHGSHESHNNHVESKKQFHKKTLDHLHDHSFIVFALAFLFIAALAIQVGSSYWSSRYFKSTAAVVRPAGKPVSGFNVTVPQAEFQSKLQSITGQPTTLTVGPYSEALNPNVIKSWLTISSNQQKSEYYIHVNEAAMSSSLVKEANEYARTPVNQVTVNEDGNSVVAVAGKNGRALSDPNGLKDQAKAAAKNVLAGQGLQFNTPLQTVAFQAFTPANFDKVLVANVTTKKMWAFQNGQQVNSFLTSDGAPDTPTPIGEFHVYAKFSVQDMSGVNLNGTKYFQPKVPWVSYFYQGSAVHGVYWHPLSWFGNINSSHGCVGLPVDQAKWVYNWDSIGTTVITHL